MINNASFKLFTQLRETKKNGTIELNKYDLFAKKNYFYDDIEFLLTAYLYRIFKSGFCSHGYNF